MRKISLRLNHSEATAIDGLLERSIAATQGLLTMERKLECALYQEVIRIIKPKVVFKYIGYKKFTFSMAQAIALYNLIKIHIQFLSNKQVIGNDYEYATFVTVNPHLHQQIIAP
jgi:hypothetical protein